MQFWYLYLANNQSYKWNKLNSVTLSRITFDRRKQFSVITRLLAPPRACPPIFPLKNWYNRLNKSLISLSVKQMMSDFVPSHLDECFLNPASTCLYFPRAGCGSVRFAPACRVCFNPVRLPWDIHPLITTCSREQDYEQGPWSVLSSTLQKIRVLKQSSDYYERNSTRFCNTISFVCSESAYRVTIHPIKTKINPNFQLPPVFFSPCPWLMPLSFLWFINEK